MRDTIRTLEQRSRKLDPGAEQRRRLMDQASQYADAFLQRLPRLRTYVADDGRHGAGFANFDEGPSDFGKLLEQYGREVDTTGILPSSGGQMGYIPGGGLFPSALGDFLAAVSNRYSGVAFAGPGAARMEASILRWMCQLVGYPETAAGDLTSGGSLATLSALVAARDAHGIEPADISQTCIYHTRQAHHCIDTALHVAGLGSVQHRYVPMNDRFRMKPEALREAVESDRRQGLSPWLVLASAGTTDTGAVDPIGAVADVCRAHGLWFHLDAAYGGFFRLSKEVRDQLEAMSRADSIVMDPHKGLGLPYGTGAVLVKRGEQLAQSFRYYADYMQDAIDAQRDEQEPYSPADHSPELTRHFRGPRLWFPLKLFGLDPFRASLSEKIWLARYFHHELARSEGFEVGPEPDLSIVTFRYCPTRGDQEETNRRLLQAVHDDGRVFITSTRINGRFTLRLAVLNFRTHLEQVDYLLGFLRHRAPTI
jgi:glutamate/tyrosine decarboxylase-like PLP-dependent enzyme